MDHALLNELVYLTRCGDALAKETLYQYFFKVVEGIVKTKVHHEFGECGKDDFVQMGMLCFNQVIDTYMPGRGASLYTYMKVCVNRRITTSLLKAFNRRHYNYCLCSLDDIICMDEKARPQDEGKPMGDCVADPKVTYAPDIQLNLTTQWSLINTYLKRKTSKREQLIFDMYRTGYTVREIAEELHISERDVYRLLHRIYQKIRCDVRMFITAC